MPGARSDRRWRNVPTPRSSWWAARREASDCMRPAWPWRSAPRVHGDYRVAVEASSTAAGIRYALRSLAPGGICTAVGFYFARSTGLPLMQMYANSTTLHVGVSHARAGIPHVIDLVAKGVFDPLAVATVMYMVMPSILLF